MSKEMSISPLVAEYVIKLDHVMGRSQEIAPADLVVWTHKAEDGVQITFFPKQPMARALHKIQIHLIQSLFEEGSEDLVMALLQKYDRKT